MPPRRSRHCQTIVLALLYALTASIVLLQFYLGSQSQGLDGLQTLTSDKLTPIAEGIKKVFDTDASDSLYDALHAAMNASYSVPSIQAGVEKKVEEQYKTGVRQLARKAEKARKVSSTILANAQKDDEQQR